MWCTMCLEYQQTQPQKKTVPYVLPCKPWEMVGDIFFVKIEYSVHCRLLQLVCYCKKAKSLAADELLKAAMIVYRTFGLPQENYFTCRHKLHMRDIHTVLQADEHRVGYNIILPLPLQW